MLEIIVVIACCKALGAKVRKRGRKAIGYQALFVLLWIGGEFAGAFLAAASGARGMSVYLGAILGAATGAGIGFLIVANLSDLSSLNFGHDPLAFAPNLPPGGEPIDPSNPYASPRQSQAGARPSVQGDPNNVLGWLDEQAGGGTR
jgi:hypothetical protein